MNINYIFKREEFILGISIFLFLSLLFQIILFLLNPWFFNSFLLFLIIFWLCPIISGLLGGMLLLPLRKIIRIRSIAMWSIEFLSFFLLVSISLYFWSSKKSYKFSDSRNKVVVVGIDGATYKIIDKMIAEGKLKNIRGIMREGIRAKFISIEPIISPAVWTEIATGKSREKTGIFSFFSIQSHLKAKRFFDIAYESGKNIGIVDWLISWPPLIPSGSKDSFWIPDHTARGTEVVPENLEFLQRVVVGVHRGEGWMGIKKTFEWLADAIRSGFRLGTFWKAGWTFVNINFCGKNKSILEKVWRRQEVALHIYLDIFLNLYANRKPQLGAITFYGTDVLPHLYWKYFQPELFDETDPVLISRYKNVIPNYYELIDKAIGEILDSIDEKTTLIILSDHGMKPVIELKDGNYCRINGKNILHFIGLDSNVDITSLGNEIIVTPKKGVKNIDEVMGAIFRYISEARIEGIQMSPFIVKSYNDYIGFSFNNNLKLKIDEIENAKIKFYDGKEAKLKDFVIENFPVYADHEPEGVLIIKGPDIRKGVAVTDHSILDIAPTILYLLDLPVAEDMEGKVMVDAFKPSYLSAHPIRKVPTYGVPANSFDGKVIPPMSPLLRKQLEDLGYLIP